MPKASVPKKDNKDRKQDLIDAGIALFGEYGLDGTTTRMISKYSGANSASIQYYFDSKDGLYLAVMNYIVDAVLEMTKGFLEDVEDRIDNGMSKQEALADYQNIMKGYCSIFVGNENIEGWAKVVMREHMQLTEAFDIFYKRYYKRSQKIMCRLVGVLLDKPADNQEVLIQVHSFFGQVLGFLIAREPLLRGMKAKRISASHKEAIQVISSNNINSVLKEASS